MKSECNIINDSCCTGFFMEVLVAGLLETHPTAAWSPGLWGVLPPPPLLLPGLFLDVLLASFSSVPPPTHSVQLEHTAAAPTVDWAV